MGPKPKITLMAAGLAFITGLTAAAALAAQGDAIGDTQMCVRLSQISSTPVIDNKTILIEMRGRNRFKRIDLVSRCSGLKMANGFSHSTSTGDLCTTDPLRVIQPVGATCMIKQIVTISAEEAKELKSKKHGKAKDKGDDSTNEQETPTGADKG